MVTVFILYTAACIFFNIYDRIYTKKLQFLHKIPIFQYGFRYIPSGWQGGPLFLYFSLTTWGFRGMIQVI